MCGIAGVVGGDPKAARRCVERMLDTISHRGPDGRNVVQVDCAVLGAVRLAIVDPEHGDQPVSADDGSIVAVLNGELYGFRGLRRELPGPFWTDCDTELLPALYRQHGRNLTEHIPGMFAFALWDGAAGRLICARDRFGEKPFFHARGPTGEFVFASEVKALLASGLVADEVDPLVLSHVVRHGTTPADRSVFASVEVLAPAHQLTLERGRCRVRRYWEPPAPNREISREDAAAELRTRLDRAVADQLVADVPVGAYLSGGVDSSTVATLAADHHRAIETFAMGFGRADDETPFASAQAKSIGSEHRTLMLDQSEIVDTLLALPSVYDEPFCDSSAVPTYLLSRETRRSVKVALTGDGADELLGGYMTWGRNHLRNKGVSGITGLGGIDGPSARRFWSRRRPSLATHYDDFRSYFSEAELCAMGLPSPASVAARTDRSSTGTIVDLLRYDLESYLPADILTKTDRASMAHGLELRSPFLDRRVAEWCLSLPSHHFVDDSREKLILRRAFADRWVPEVASRPKQGFGAPMGEWLARPDVAELVSDHLRDETAAIYDFLDVEGVRPFIGGDGQQTWNLLTVALWAEARRRG